MHVIVIHIGPVQDFIESSRKCRDLWFSSWLISELARAVAVSVVSTEGRPEAEVLVFPGARTDNPKRSVANKIVARVAAGPRLVADKAHAAMKDRLAKIRDRAFARVGRGEKRREDLFHIDEARAQVDDLMEFLWAAAPEGDGGYRAALDEAERLLGAVKNTRSWSQPTWAKEGVPKSSLDGQRESVLHESLYPNPRHPVTQLPPEPERLRRAFGVHRSERLCGVGLLKRFGNRYKQDDGETPERIFSTSHVASGPFRAGLAAKHAQGPWDDYRNGLEKIDLDLVARLDVVPRPDDLTGYVDGSVFYEGRVIETLEELGVDSEANVTRAREALRGLLQTVREIGEPTPYYALLLGDGDRMGHVIGSLRGPDAHMRHRELSEDLEGFASSARAIVEDEHDGALVYAGGDDVLALVPLHRALECASTLARRFADAMRRWKVADGGEERSPTLSIGVAIVHYMYPLDEALRMVRATEKVAKAVRGKNALAMVVKKRGGEAVQVAGTWGEIDERLGELIKLHEADAISTKAQYELMDLTSRLGEAGSLDGTLREVQRAEAARILGRKREGGGDKSIDERTREALKGLGAFEDPARLGRELYVAHLIAAASDQAQGGGADSVATQRVEVTP